MRSPRYIQSDGDRRCDGHLLPLPQAHHRRAQLDREARNRRRRAPNCGWPLPPVGPAGYLPIVEHPQFHGFRRVPVVRALTLKAGELRLPFHVGVVWTSDAFYSEAGTTFETLSRFGVKSVEMECSILFLLAQLRGLRSGAILAVDGNLALGQKKGAFEAGGQPIEFSKRVLGALKRATKVALEAIVFLHRAGELR